MKLMRHTYHTLSLYIAVTILLSVIAAGQTIIKTSFDGSDSTLYSVGSLHGKSVWSVSAGTGEVTAIPSFVHNGTRGVKLAVSGGLLDVRHTPFAGNVPGVTGTVYFDMMVKIDSLLVKEFTIVGHDLYGGSVKRVFVVEFSVPAGDSGEIRLYNGSTKVKYRTYRKNQWYRVTGKVNYAAGSYQVSVNGLLPMTAQFRESYTPTASGSRAAGIKEYHQLYFCLGGGTSDGAVGTVVAAMDSLYVGTTPPSGVNFGTVVTNYSVSVTQPVVGSITVNPSGTSFPESTLVTAKLSIPSGYKNYGWTGDLTGTDSVKQFLVFKNMTIGAIVSIDSVNPPPVYTITVQQPDTGVITLSPSLPQYYSHTNVTATVSIPFGFKNSGWTGDLSGTEVSKQFTVTKNFIIGVNITKDTVISGAGQKKVFTSASTFKSGITNAVPGDTLELVSGTFDVGGIIIIKTGTEQLPITLRAQVRGATELTGGSRFTIRQSAYIVIEGFLFTSDGGTVIKGENSHHTRITRNTFRLKEPTSAKWVLFGGLYSTGELNTHHNRVDHNLFEEKHQLGNYVTIDGTPDDFPPAKSSQYDRIDHNHFRNMGPRAVNEMEAVRLGQSSISATSGYTLVEFNLFEQCDGDPEIISVKTNDNIIRYNTFLRSQGTASLRQGNNSQMYGNYFVGKGKPGTGGIRAYGTGHWIFNNYFEGLTGDTWDAALAITNGDVDTGSTSMSSHHRPNRITAAFNTFVNNANNIQFGFTNNGSYGKSPVNITVANNLIVGSQNELIKIITQPTSITYSGNVAFPQGTATVGIAADESQVKILNPLLAFTDSVWRLTYGSPVINAAIGNFPMIAEDIEGQLRDVLKDVGADEFNALKRINRPLRPVDVGPNGPDSIAIVTLIKEPKTTIVPSGFALLQNYPNPFNPVTNISFTVPASGQITVKVFDILGKEVATVFNGIAESGTAYAVPFNAASLPSGIYFSRLEFGGQRIVKKMLMIK